MIESYVSLRFKTSVSPQFQNFQRNLKLEIFKVFKVKNLNFFMITNQLANK